MKILYSAIDQTVPGTKGGSVHVAAVAEGLAALGHEVTALVTPGTRQERNHTGVCWVAMPPPLSSTHLRMVRAPQVARLLKSLRPDVVIERYHNFGGEALTAAHGVGALAVLEVNAPIVDHPGSRKAWIDRAVLVEPMRRWRERLCRIADLIVTPSAAILPSETARDRIVVLEWGADTERFQPAVAGPVPYTRPRASTVAVFAGAFRNWHGAVGLVRAIKDLESRGRNDVGAIMIGNGPELSRVRDEASASGNIVFTGALPHDLMPAALAAADIGVAPFDPTLHPPLALGFYWSPLKIFEYMAAGLPVVAPAIDRIPHLLQNDREAVLYDPSNPRALADSLLRLTDPALRAALGGAARERAVHEYSWAAHCRALDAAFAGARQRRSA